MKKVFRIWKYVSRSIELGYEKVLEESLKLGWPYLLEGLTPEEINEIGYVYSESWLVVEGE